MRKHQQDHIVTYLGGPLHGFTSVLEPKICAAYLTYRGEDGNYGKANRKAHWVRKTITGVAWDGVVVSRDFMVLEGWDENAEAFMRQNPAFFTRELPDTE